MSMSLATTVNPLHPDRGEDVEVLGTHLTPSGYTIVEVRYLSDDVVSHLTPNQLTNYREA